MIIFRLNIKLFAFNCVLAIFFVGCTSASVRAVPDSEIAKKTFVIVHGAWGGGWGFKELASIIQASGHEVYRPTLTGLGERVHLANPKISLETHIQDVVNVIEFEDLRQVTLVGHSYGGMIITGVADRIPKRLSRIIYIDAHLPNDGESMFDLIGIDRARRLTHLANARGDGWRIPPWWPDKKKDVDHPLATFRDPVRLRNPATTEIPGTYILTLEPGADIDRFSYSAERARRRGWRYHELRAGHNVHWTMPHELATLLMAAE